MTPTKQRIRPPGTTVDRIGTLEVINTGRRCSVRKVKIYAVWCPNCVGDPTLLHDGILGAYVDTMKMLDGYHLGCDPSSGWRTDFVGTKLQHDATRSLLDRVDACPACNETTCTGASS